MWCVPLLGLMTVLPILPEDITVAGRVSLRDLSGQWIADADGRFVMRLFQEVWTEREVEFTDGLFTIRLPRGSSCEEVLGFRSNLGTGYLNWVRAERIKDWTGPLELHACLAPPLVLSVLDPETNEPLDCVDVSPRLAGDYDLQWYRGRHGELLEVESDWAESAALFEQAFVCRVRAPGRVESLVSLPPDSANGVQFVYLERAGTLALSFREPSPSTRHTFLEVSSVENGFEHRCRIDPRGVPIIEGLRPGPYVVRVVHEFLDFRRIVHCEQTVYVHPGVLTSERMVITPLEDDTDGPWEPIDGQ